MAHALKKGRNEDLARKRLLHLGAEVRDPLSGATAEPERRSKPLAGPRQDQSGNELEVRPPPRVSGKGVGQRSILREELGHGPQTQRNSPR